MSNGAQLPRGFNTKAFLRLALPMIVSRAGLAAMGIADGVMVARFQAHEFAWLSLAEGTLGRLLDVFVAFLIGGLSLVARHFGRGDHSGARAVWLRTIPAAIGLGTLGLLASMEGKNILTLMGQKPDLAANAAPVMAILGAGYPFALLAISAALYLEGTNRPHFVAVSVVTANLVNIGLNWLFIGGHWGLTAMGARGSALSTSSVRLVLCVALMAYAWRVSRKERVEGGAELHEVERIASQRAQWRLGLGAAVTVAAMVTLTAPLTLIAGRLGVLALASFSAAWNLGGPAMLVALGMADAAGNYVGAEAGRGSLREAAKVSWASLRLTLIPIAVVSTILFIWAVPCASLYTRDSNLRASMAGLLPFVGLILLVDSVGFIMISSLRALRETAWPTGIEIGSMALLMPVAVSLAWKAEYGVVGLFIAMLTAGTARAAALTWRFWWRTNSGAAELRPELTAELRLDVE